MLANYWDGARRSRAIRGAGLKILEPNGRDRPVSRRGECAPSARAAPGLRC